MILPWKGGGEQYFISGSSIFSILSAEILKQLGVAQGSFPFVWRGKSKGLLWLLALVSEDLRLAIGSGSVGGGGLGRWVGTVCVGKSVCCLWFVEGVGASMAGELGTSLPCLEVRIS